MAEHNDLGRSGEEIAVEHLKKTGYGILKTNWRSGRNEIDIIAEKGDVLAVIEVKTRSGVYFGEPELFVTRQKQKQIIKAANAYVTIQNEDRAVRFDIISVVLSGWETRVTHIPDAFYPTL